MRLRRGGQPRPSATRCRQPRSHRRRQHADALTAENRTYPALVPLFEAAEERFRSLLADIDRYSADLLDLATSEAAPPQPRFRQDWFPRLDACAAYALVRSRRPTRLTEVGCGHSTRWFARAAADGGAATRIRAIDPRPRASLSGLGVEVLRQPVQQAGMVAFAELAPGDVLSLDGSHLLMPGSDVDIVLNQVLPCLPAGVLVHVHDIFLPDDYPRHWFWRGYNEQLAVAALLHAGSGWTIEWSSHWVATRMGGILPQTVIALLPLPRAAIESSLWLRKG